MGMPLFNSPRLLTLLGDVLEEAIKTNFPKCTKLVGLESRGFLMGMAVASRLNVGFVPTRKRGKLPGATFCQEYALEYGTDCVELEKNALDAGDDLIATGGTLGAAESLIAQTEAKLLGSLCLIEI